MSKPKCYRGPHELAVGKAVTAKFATIFFSYKNRRKDVFIRSPSHEIKQDSLDGALRRYERGAVLSCSPFSKRDLQLRAVLPPIHAAHPCTPPQPGRSTAAQQAPPPPRAWTSAGSKAQGPAGRDQRQNHPF